MAETTLNTIIRLRKDTEANYNTIGYVFVPADGEVCIVETTNLGTKLKVGDGIHTFNQLEYITEGQSIFRGYYLNGEFYKDSTYQETLPHEENKMYVDINETGIYMWVNLAYKPIITIATESVAGIMRLYNTHGENTDGTMTQRAITHGISDIHFELDDGEDECLRLDLPW